MEHMRSSEEDPGRVQEYDDYGTVPLGAEENMSTVHV